jgi:hypothetical protein
VIAAVAPFLQFFRTTVLVLLPASCFMSLETESSLSIKDLTSIQGKKFQIRVDAARILSFESNWQAHFSICRKFANLLSQPDFIKSEAFLFFVRVWILPDNCSAMLAAWRKTYLRKDDSDFDLWKSWTEDVRFLFYKLQFLLL